MADACAGHKMSAPKNKVPNDNQSEEDSDTFQQANPDAAFHLYAIEDKETDVCGTLLREEKERSRERGGLVEEIKSRNVLTRAREYIVLNVNDGKPSDKPLPNPSQEQNAQEPAETPLGPNQGQTQEPIRPLGVESPVPQGTEMSSTQQVEGTAPQGQESSPLPVAESSPPQNSATATSLPQEPELLPQEISQQQVPLQGPNPPQLPFPPLGPYPPNGPYPPQNPGPYPPGGPCPPNGPNSPNTPYPPDGPYTPQGPNPPPLPFPPLGPYPPNGPYPPQSPRPYPPGGPYPPDPPYPPDGTYPPNGPNPPDTPYPPDGQYPPQGARPFQEIYSTQGPNSPPAPFQVRGSYQPRGSFKPPEQFPRQGSGYPTQGTYLQQGNQGTVPLQAPKRRSLIPPQIERIRCIVITGALVDYEPENEDRNIFVKFVLGIVLMMLIVTISSLIAILSISGAREFLLNTGIYFLFPLIFTLIGLYCYMSCSQKGRTYPCNVACLSIAVSLQTAIAAIITVYFKTQIVMYSVMTTAIVIFVCVILAHTKFDFTSGILYFVALGVTICVLCVILIMSMSTYKLSMKPALAIVLMLFTVMSVLSLIMDLQIILGGRTIQLRVTDYALAAFMLYTSIMDIFIKMVLLLGISN